MSEEEENDVSQFKELFISESREILTVLNTNLLELERNPAENNLINEVFRTAHTLKGMAATMGFDKIVELTHSMENLLDKVRAGITVLTTDTINVFFTCFYILEKLVEEVDNGKERNIDITEIVNKLKS